jgi:hypothetical protein
MTWTRWRHQERAPAHRRAERLRVEDGIYTGKRRNQESRQTRASGDTNSPEGCMLLEFDWLQRPLWIRRVLVPAQEGQ